MRIPTEEMTVKGGPVTSPSVGITLLPGEGEVHLWRLPGLVDAPLLAEYEPELSAGERARGRAFRSRDDKDRFVSAHGGLRRLLASYTGSRPAGLMYAPGSGKPSLRSPHSAGAIRFNMSHSGDLVLVAVAAGREVGVDIERIRTDLDVRAIAGKCFCPAELRMLDERTGAVMEDLFYSIWSRKEAYVKALGGGISLDLRAIDVSSAPSVQERRWHLLDLPLPRGYRGALAADGPVGRISMFDSIDPVSAMVTW